MQKNKPQQFQVGDTIYVKNDLYIAIYLQPSDSFDSVSYAKDGRIGYYKGIFTNSNRKIYIEFTFDVGNTVLDGKSGFIEYDQFQSNFYTNKQISKTRNYIIAGLLVALIGYFIYKNRS